MISCIITATYISKSEKKNFSYGATEVTLQFTALIKQRIAPGDPIFQQTQILPTFTAICTNNKVNIIKTFCIRYL